MRNNPHIYEINLMTWLHQLSRIEGRAVGLSDIPTEQWEALKELGMDTVWLMGIWERSPLSQNEARSAEGLRKECEEILAGFQLEDLGGSPYAVRAYRPDRFFGAFSDIRALRRRLHDMGMALVLDFVPNHTACDHDWVIQHPHYYINTSAQAARTCPEGFFISGKTEEPICIAHGRDPYFPPWTDTAQLNYSNPETHREMAEVLKLISKYCDGVRCDMAMLVLNEVFIKTWAQFAGKEKIHEFWPYAIGTIKEADKDFFFIAEAYWGTGKRLLEAGFDYVYDKDFYDALVNADIEDLKRQLSQPVPDQERMLRFLENHDEPRAMKVFGREKIRAAMVIHATVPGAKLYHQGQFEGRVLRVPVQLRRAPEEPVDREFYQFCASLMAEVDQPVYHQGTWQLCGIDGWLDNHSCTNLVAWSLQLEGERRIIVINYSTIPSQGRVRLPLNWIWGGGELCLVDIFRKEKYVYQVEAVKRDGVYVALEPWNFHFCTCAFR